MYLVTYWINLPKFKFCWSGTFSNFTSTNSYHNCTIKAQTLVLVPSSSPFFETRVGFNFQGYKFLFLILSTKYLNFDLNYHIQGYSKSRLYYFGDCFGLILFKVIVSWVAIGLIKVRIVLLHIVFKLSESIVTNVKVLFWDCVFFYFADISHPIVLSPVYNAWIM